MSFFCGGKKRLADPLLVDVDWINGALAWAPKIFFSRRSLARYLRLLQFLAVRVTRGKFSFFGGAWLLDAVFDICWVGCSDGFDGFGD